MPEGWTRRAALTPADGASEELWELWEDERVVAAAPVRARYGKPLDVMAFRGIDAAAHRRAALDLCRAAAALHDGEADAGPCPCCEGAGDVERLASVAGVDYVRCRRCGHGYVPRPPIEALARRFAASEEIAAVYTDPDTAAVRMEQVVAPKLAWALEAAERSLGRPPASLLAIGAGAGHKVAGARRRGLRAEGYELNRHCCSVARERLGVELRHGDVLEARSGGERFDLVTLWGVLEYVPDPTRLVARAREFLAPGGTMVVEVPRVDSISTAVQRELPQFVARHLDPASHLNAFSDASIATVLWRSGLVPSEAWYFGMDAFELASQLALHGELSEELCRATLGLQPDLDRARLADDLVIAATGAAA